MFETAKRTHRLKNIQRDIIRLAGAELPDGIPVCTPKQSKPLGAFVLVDCRLDNNAHPFKVTCFGDSRGVEFIASDKPDDIREVIRKIVQWHADEIADWSSNID